MRNFALFAISMIVAFLITAPIAPPAMADTLEEICAEYPDLAGCDPNMPNTLEEYCTLYPDWAGCLPGSDFCLEYPDRKSCEFDDGLIGGPVLPSDTNREGEDRDDYTDAIPDPVLEEGEPATNGSSGTGGNEEDEEDTRSRGVRIIDEFLEPHGGPDGAGDGLEGNGPILPSDSNPGGKPADTSTEEEDDTDAFIDEMIELEEQDEMDDLEDYLYGVGSDDNEADGPEANDGLPGSGPILPSDTNPGGKPAETTTEEPGTLAPDAPTNSEPTPPPAEPATSSEPSVEPDDGLPSGGPVLPGTNSGGRPSGEPSSAGPSNPPGFGVLLPDPEEDTETIGTNEITETEEFPETEFSPVDPESSGENNTPLITHDDNDPDFAGIAPSPEEVEANAGSTEEEMHDRACANYGRLSAIAEQRDAEHAQVSAEYGEVLGNQPTIPTLTPNLESSLREKRNQLQETLRAARPAEEAGEEVNPIIRERRDRLRGEVTELETQLAAENAAIIQARQARADREARLRILGPRLDAARLAQNSARRQRAAARILCEGE